MRTLIALLTLSAATFYTQAQELTFDKQLEQAITDFRRFGTPVTQTTILSNDAAITEAQLSALAAVMSQKDGYIRLVRNSDAELTVVHAAFVTVGDLLSVCRFSGIECQATSSAVPAAKAVFGE